MDAVLYLSCEGARLIDRSSSDGGGPRELEGVLLCPDLVEDPSDGRLPFSDCDATCGIVGGVCLGSAASTGVLRPESPLEDPGGRIVLGDGGGFSPGTLCPAYGCMRDGLFRDSIDGAVRGVACNDGGTDDSVVDSSEPPVWLTGLLNSSSLCGSNSAPPGPIRASSSAFLGPSSSGTFPPVYFL